MGLPGTARVGGPGGDSQVGNVADAGKGLAPEAVSGDGQEIIETLQLRGGESLTQNGQVVLLVTVSKVRWQGSEALPRSHGRCR